jgi:hypothetical protein
MNDDLEQGLGRLTPRGVRPDLREKVLAAVTAELQSAGGVPFPGIDSTPVAAHDENEHGPAPVAPTSPPAKADSPWLRRAAVAAAASLLLGIGLNVWVSNAADRHLAALFGPPPVPKGAAEIASDVAAFTDAATGRWVYRRLTAPIPPDALAAAHAKYSEQVQKLIDELQTASKDPYHETRQKDAEMDGDRAPRVRGHSTDCQRRIRLDYRCTA